MFGPYYTCPKPLLTFGHNPSSLPKCCFQHCDDGSKKHSPDSGCPDLNRARIVEISHPYKLLQQPCRGWQSNILDLINSLSMFEHYLHLSSWLGKFNFYWQKAKHCPISATFKSIRVRKSSWSSSMIEGLSSGCTDTFGQMAWKCSFLASHNLAVKDEAII